jgi:hypothetical protein
VINTIKILDFVISYRLSQLQEQKCYASLERPFFKVVEYFLRRGRITSMSPKEKVTQCKIGYQDLRKYVLISVMFAVVFSLGVGIPLGLANTKDNGGCYWENMQLPMTIFLGLCILSMPYSYYLVRNCRDSLWVRTELLVYIFSFGIGLTVYATIGFYPIDQTWYFARHNEFFALVIGYYTPYLFSIYWPLYLIFRKSQQLDDSDVIQYSFSTFLKFLRTPELYVRLKAEVAAELSSENIVYYETVQKIYEGLNLPF